MGDLIVFSGTDDQVRLIKDTIFKDGSDDELKLFIYTCKYTGLDPLLRQIYPVKRFDRKLGRDRVTFQTSIDGLRLIADRTSRYAGNDDAIFSYKEDDAAKMFPQSATVTVYKLLEGQRYAFTATARWVEYVPAPPNDFMWQNKKHIMLAKCAEALALRKAFPAETSKVYIKEEMESADAADAQEPRPEPAVDMIAPSVVDVRPASQKSLKMMYALIPKAFPDDDKEASWQAFKEWLIEEFSWSQSTKELNQSQLSNVIDALLKRVENRGPSNSNEP